MLLLALGLMMFGCVSVQEQNMRSIQIDTNSPLKKVIWSAITKSGAQMIKAKEWISKNKNWKETQSILYQYLATHHPRLPKNLLRNSAHLYTYIQHPASIRLMYDMVNSSQEESKKAGWTIAAELPTKEVREFIERQVSHLIINERDAELKIPELAKAIAANDVKSSYSILKSGLMETGDIEFAKAMVYMKKKGSSREFLEYLIQASPEELRQLSIKKVNPLTATYILKHMKSFPPSISSTMFSYLFYYSVSRYPAFSELTFEIFDRYASDSDQVYISALLARMPKWVQIAFVENTRRNMNITRKRILIGLKNSSALPDVIDEISNLRF